ncbi:MAG: sulfoxide reductase heme-binding subunit YedZ [Candidatus Azotimanducaceae bacterium]|jgi:sulfoxide reductase heme-binding subunit YedZ
MNSTAAVQRPARANFLLPALGAVMLVSTPLFVWQVVLQDLNETTALLYTRYTAHISFLFFLTVFLAKPFQVLRPSTFTSRWLKNRRDLGLAFALAHTIHMGAIILNYRVQDLWFSIDDGAALAIYFFLGLMVVTSNKMSARRLGKIWKWIHKVGLYALFAGFFVTYLGRTLDHDALLEGDLVPEFFYVCFVANDCQSCVVDTYRSFLESSLQIVGLFIFPCTKLFNDLQMHPINCRRKTGERFKIFAHVTLLAKAVLQTNFCQT